MTEPIIAPIPGLFLAHTSVWWTIIFPHRYPPHRYMYLLHSCHRECCSFCLLLFCLFIDIIFYGGTRATKIGTLNLQTTNLSHQGLAIVLRIKRERLGTTWFSDFHQICGIGEVTVSRLPAIICILLYEICFSVQTNSTKRNHLFCQNWSPCSEAKCHQQETYPSPECLRPVLRGKDGSFRTYCRT